MANRYVYRTTVKQQMGGNLVMSADDTNWEAVQCWTARVVQSILEGTVMQTGSEVVLEVVLQRYEYSS